MPHPSHSRFYRPNNSFYFKINFCKNMNIILSDNCEWSLPVGSLYLWNFHLQLTTCFFGVTRVFWMWHVSASLRPYCISFISFSL
jgi:hypothetical protein